jgi:hypothetical protein
MDASKRCSSKLAAWLGVAAVTGLGVAAAAVASDDTTAGGWQDHKVTFAYMGDVTTGTTYSCQGLMDTLTYLLTQSGARVNAPVQVTPCINGAGAPSTLLTARLDFSTFKPAGDQGGEGASAPGTWRKVLFSETHSSPTLHTGDCELVLEFKDKLLQYFTTRDQSANMHCIPYQRELWGLSFETFVPSDTPKRAVGGG